MQPYSDTSIRKPVRQGIYLFLQPSPVVSNSSRYRLLLFKITEIPGAINRNIVMLTSARINLQSLPSHNSYTHDWWDRILLSRLMHYHSIARSSLLLYPLRPLFYLSGILMWWQDTWCVTVRSPMANKPLPLLTNQTANDNRPSHSDLLLPHLSLIAISVPWNSGAYLLRG